MTKPLTWRTRGGAVVRISEMGDSHLLNTIRYVQRTHRPRCLAIALSASAYAETAPDGAAEAAEMVERDAYKAADDDSEESLAELVPEYPALLREAKRRHLAL